MGPSGMAVELVPMIELLHRLKFPKGSLPPEGRVGILTFNVNSETGPYLVTSSKGLTWVADPSSEGTVNAAFRPNTTPTQLFREVIEAVCQAGQHYKWGNVHDLSSQGIKAAIEHVKSYEPDEVVVLTSRDIDVNLSDRTSVRKVGWLPPKTAVALPAEREYVGAWGRVSRRSLVGVVHNPARGIAIATGGLDVVSGSRADQHDVGAQY